MTYTVSGGALNSTQTQARKKLGAFIIIIIIIVVVILFAQ